ncbi:adenylosuccinate synthase [Streptomyces lavendulae]|uniref:adenylosuccinate synthase n=1 Tax=Streptomyces lavendulae TaxID=1914 RepID=UPI0037F6A043
MTAQMLEHDAWQAEDASAAVLDQIRAMRAESQTRRLGALSELGMEPPAVQRTTWVGDLQQGDGGKGAMADRLAARHQIIVRVQGGDNAGHTTVFTGKDGKERTLSTHLMPSGLRHPGTVGILGNGVLVNPERFAQELADLQATDPDAGSRVFVSDRCHLVLPLHRIADARQESRKEARGQAIGTTGRGIGPANVSKVNRIGVRVIDLHDMDLVAQRVRENIAFFGLDEDQAEHDLDFLMRHREALLERSADSMRLINSLLADGYSVLFEGAQGPLIDLEHGIYPYVTTSPTAFYSVGSGSGLDPAAVQNRIGVLKVYQTMVGNGAFVSEDQGELGGRLQAAGGEFGTTTGRPRRCGWLDLVHSRWAVELNNYTSVVLTKLDVLDSFERIGVCVAYEADGELIHEFRPEHRFLENCKPVIRYFDGWQCSTRDVTSFDELPEAAKEFVEFVGTYLEAEIGGVTKGPRDDDMLVRTGTALEGVVQG